MGLGMFSAQPSPIAIDFGSSSLKLLQVSSAEQPDLLAAVEIPIPSQIRGDLDKQMEFYASELPPALKKGQFKGKRCILSIPCQQSIIQHLQLSGVTESNMEDLVQSNLQIQLNCMPGSLVSRSFPVASVYRDDQPATEIITLAIRRELVMRYVSMLKKCKLTAVGVHSELMAMIHAFDHLNRRDSDQNTRTLYVDFGWSATSVAIAHGSNLVFARAIALGGRDLDLHISDKHHCDISAAHSQRLSLMNQTEVAHTSHSPEGMAIFKAGLAQGKAQEAAMSNQGGVAVQTDRRIGQIAPALRHDIGGADTHSPIEELSLKEVIDTMTDELSMCVRYHDGLFPGRQIDRVVMVGGEARQNWLCRTLVKSLRLPGQLGDPLARLAYSSNSNVTGLTFGQPQPGWAVPCGLTACSIDL